MLSQSTQQRFISLARICGHTLLLVFGVSVVFALFPLDLRSSIWGTQLSSRIIDGTSLALVGVALLCAAVLLQPIPENPNSSSRNQVKLLARQRAGALRLCRVGVISLALLAVWQLLLLVGNTAQINQRNLSQAKQISPAIQQAEQFIRQASASELEQPWQRFLSAGAPGMKQPVSSTEQKRQLLLSALKAQQRQMDLNISSRGDQARLTLVLDTLRRVALCFIYGSGFFFLRRHLT